MLTWFICAFAFARQIEALNHITAARLKLALQNDYTLVACKQARPSRGIISTEFCSSLLTLILLPIVIEVSPNIVQQNLSVS
jgi:hypothetical protein